jgi:hypothetical protein
MGRTELCLFAADVSWVAPRVGQPSPSQSPDNSMPGRRNQDRAPVQGAFFFGATPSLSRCTAAPSPQHTRWQPFSTSARRRRAVKDSLDAHAAKQARKTNQIRVITPDMGGQRGESNREGDPTLDCERVPFLLAWGRRAARWELQSVKIQIVISRSWLCSLALESV